MRDVVGTVVADLPDCAPDVAAEAASGPATVERHAAFVTRAAPLHGVEARPAPAPAVARPSLRVAAWNLERCKDVEGAASLLRAVGADVALLSEMDVGMARSGNRHTVRDLAGQVGAGYAFGVEYVELGLGIGAEITDNAGQSNARGLHGNAVLSRVPFAAPVVVPLEESGTWYMFDWHHRRVGGRVAVGATVELAGRPVAVFSVHLENHSSANNRREQMAPLTRALAGLPDPAMPAIVAGDLNTADLPVETEMDEGWFEQAGRREPLFALMREAGFDWLGANTTDQTRRRIDDGRPPPGRRRVDWIFTRGLVASNPAVHPAVDAGGRTLSDHELLTVEVAFPA